MFPQPRLIGIGSAGDRRPYADQTPFNARILFAPCLPKPDDGKPTYHSQSDRHAIDQVKVIDGMMT
jgi:hypothetical protein